MVESEKFDALIIGAGPAGSFAAEQLARAGARVALFDGRPPGEPKACGGGVTSKALKAWPHLLEALGRTIEEVELYSPAGTRVRLKLDAPFAIYSRVAFDSYLRDRAIRAGARVIPERVSVALDGDGQEDWTARARGGESWRGRLLVAADGANSPIARRLAGALPNAEMEVAFGYRAPLPKGDDAPTVIAFLPGWAGYAWGFPRLDHVSFGIATPQEKFSREVHDALLWDFMVNYYRMREDNMIHPWSSMQTDVASSEQIRISLLESTERYAARIPSLAPDTWIKRSTVGKGWALLGDAAGFVNPITDEGIYYALRSAELFAQAYVQGNPSLYEEYWRADFGHDLQYAAAIRSRFYGVLLGAPFTERMIKFAQFHKGIRLTLSDLIIGKQDHLTLKRTLLRQAVRVL